MKTKKKSPHVIYDTYTHHSYMEGGDRAYTIDTCMPPITPPAPPPGRYMQAGASVLFFCTVTANVLSKGVRGAW